MKKIQKALGLFSEKDKMESFKSQTQKLNQTLEAHRIPSVEGTRGVHLGRVSGETAIGGREKKLSHFKNSHLDFLTKKQKICNQKH